MAAASATGTFCPVAATDGGAISLLNVLPTADPASLGNVTPLGGDTAVGSVKFVGMFGNAAGAGNGKPGGSDTPLAVLPEMKKNLKNKRKGPKNETIQSDTMFLI